MRACAYTAAPYLYVISCSLVVAAMRDVTGCRDASAVLNFHSHMHSLGSALRRCAYGAWAEVTSQDACIATQRSSVNVTSWVGGSMRHVPRFGFGKGKGQYIDAELVAAELAAQSAKGNEVNAPPPLPAAPSQKLKLQTRQQAGGATRGARRLHGDKRAPAHGIMRRFSEFGTMQLTSR